MQPVIIRPSSASSAAPTRKRENGAKAWLLQQAIEQGAFGLNDVPGLVKEIIDDERWRELIVKMARENPGWGYTRIRYALFHLGHDVARSTVASVLAEHGIDAWNGKSPSGEDS